MEQKLIVSVVFPVYNEHDNIDNLYSEVRKSFIEAGVEYEMIFVDNGSDDGSLGVIKKLVKNDHSVHYISLSRNFGHQGGLFAGMNFCNGNAVITMDADLQHPPALIPDMIRLWRDGHDVVFTTKRNNHQKGLKRFQTSLFYKLISKVSGLQLSFGQSDFRLVDRSVSKLLLSMPEYRKFLRGLVVWSGFNQIGLEYEVAERYRGRSKFSYKALCSLAVDGILSFSTLPLRWMLALGVITALAAISYGGIALVIGVLARFGWNPNNWVPPGWTALAAAITFLGGVQLIAIGVVGEYVGRIYEQVKGRPSFIVKETSESLSESGRQSDLSGLIS